MSLRSESIIQSSNREVRRVERLKDSLGNPLPVSEFFGNRTFGLDNLQEKLSRDTFDKLMAMVNDGQRLPKEAGNEIAHVVKEWAIAQGVTHFCHWFQPMTGLTAEKHDAFITTKSSELGQTQVIEKISGSNFLQSEPDASSFPSGGMRNTFEARGYTTWDPKSPLFIMAHTNGRTLCIPSAYISYHGQALDNKTPLLRSVEVLSKEATRFLRILGHDDVNKVTVNLGAEQEYFLIDRSFYSARPDLIMTGRSLIGAQPTRGQQLEDHYFGSIPSRILGFMHELEQEMYRLGVPLKTRHNEVAPSQFEVAPIFEDANVASDHNCLLMDMLRRIALRHNMVCLLHEKPFAGINGSGKHNNWSMATDTGENLLEPGDNPHQNIRFLASLATVLKAVHEHAGLLRAGIASPGNDHRLGANEAPPAIMSVFLGETLTRICNQLEKGEVITDSAEESVLSLGVSSLPVVARDNTDRNRTSPFAFTGNKFEFRAVGGSANVSVPVTFLTAATADAFRQMADRLEKKIEAGESKENAALSLVSEVLKETKAIRFEGNNYGDEWVAEAKRRGLPNLLNTPEALAVLRDEKQVSFMVEQNVLNKEELESRHNVMLERYNKQIDLEARTLLEMVDTYVVPALESQLTSQATLVEQLDEAKSKTAIAVARQRLAVAENTYCDLSDKGVRLAAALDALQSEGDEIKQADAYANSVLPAMEAVRVLCDQAELIVADKTWELPKYREILFLR